jgi:hypothetical protein
MTVRWPLSTQGSTHPCGPASKATSWQLPGAFKVHRDLKKKNMEEQQTCRGAQERAARLAPTKACARLLVALPQFPAARSARPSEASRRKRPDSQTPVRGHCARARHGRLWPQWFRSVGGVRRPSNSFHCLGRLHHYSIIIVLYHYSIIIVLSWCYYSVLIVDCESERVLKRLRESQRVLESLRES